MKAIKLTILLFMFLFYGFLNSSNAQWVQVSSGMGNVTVYSLSTNVNTIFAGAYGVYKSTNNGATWTQTSLNNVNVYSLAANVNTIFAGTGNGFYISTNNGTNWTYTNLSPEGLVFSLAANGNNIFAGTYLDGQFWNAGEVYLSTNNGSTWTQTSYNYNNGPVYSLAANGNYIFAGTAGALGSGAVYLSTDNGTTWTQTSLNNVNVSSLAVNGNNIFAGTWRNGVYLSTNNGTTWTQGTQVGLNNLYVYSLAVKGNNVFAGTGHPTPKGVYVSNDNGANWTQRNEGLDNLYVQALCILNSYIFAGTNGNSVYRRTLDQFTGIEPISSEIPEGFSLSQNYPNPFNPTTKIKFSIPPVGQRHAFDVQLVVYDILGREVTTFVNEQLKPGTYEVEWNAANVPSGVYFYKLTVHQGGSSTGDYTETKKMILIK